MMWFAYVIIGLLVLVAYMLKEASEQNVRMHEVKASGEPDHFTLFFISDVHNRKISKKMLATVPKVEAVIIGGDFADQRVSLAQIEENIMRLCTVGPVYFVWGNNDREVGEGKLRRLLKKHHVTIVENDAVLLANRANKTWISAINDTSLRDYSFKKALAKCEEQDITLVVSHNPQVFYQVHAMFKPTLLMGGHLHGGQIRFGKFGVHPHGSFSMREGVATLISNGYGTTLLPLRFMAKPECHVIHVRVER